jgi:hypothetical protein
MTQNYITKSNLFLQYGSDKAFPEMWGEYVMYGPNRIIEGTLDLTGAAYPAGSVSTTAGTPTIISNTEIFPSGPNSSLIFIERIEISAEIATASGTSWNLGLIKMDRSTIPSGYGQALIAAEVAATFATAGNYVNYTTGTSKVGSLIGSGPAIATGPYYLTCYTTGTFTTGQLKVRIHYHTIPTVGIVSNISQ